MFKLKMPYLQANILPKCHIARNRQMIKLDEIRDCRKPTQKVINLFMYEGNTLIKSYFIINT